MKFKTSTFERLKFGIQRNTTIVRLTEILHIILSIMYFVSEIYLYLQIRLLTERIYLYVRKIHVFVFTCT